MLILIGAVIVLASAIGGFVLQGGNPLVLIDLSKGTFRTDHDGTVTGVG